ncbi:MAG: bactofilin family protein [Pseudomonadota bacterium]
MFTRQTKTAPAVEAAPPRKMAVASLVAEGVTIRGDIATAGDLHLDGAVEGDLAAGHLTIGETGSVNGSVQAECVEIRGRVTGAISARVVRLLATAHVDGDISHAELSVEAGAHFAGRSLVFEAPTAEEPRALSVVAAE